MSSNWRNEPSHGSSSFGEDVHQAYEDGVSGICFSQIVSFIIRLTHGMKNEFLRWTRCFLIRGYHYQSLLALLTHSRKRICRNAYRQSSIHSEPPASSLYHEPYHASELPVHRNMVRDIPRFHLYLGFTFLSSSPSHVRWYSSLNHQVSNACIYHSH